MDPQRAKFPDAARLLRFIDAARQSKHSPIYHLTRFYKLAEEEVAGPWWKKHHDMGSRDASVRRPINPLGEMVRTYHPHLIGDQILPVVEPSGLGSRSSAKMLEYRLRQWVDDAAFDQHDERCVLDSLLCCGAYYVFRREGGMQVATEEGTLDQGQPGVIRVAVPHMVIDPNADQWDTASGIGHWVEVDRQAMLAQGIGDEKLLMQIPNIWENLDETKLDNRREGGPGDTDQYIDDRILLWEFTFSNMGKRYRCMLPPTKGADGFVVLPFPLDKEPEGSPYVVTALNSMPSSLMPVSPAMGKMDEHLARVGIYAKIMKQIEDLERKYVVKPGAQDMVMRIKDKHADSFITGDPAAIGEFIVGGMLKELVEAQGFLQAEGQNTGPNIQLAGGQSQPGTTATSNSILAGNAAVVMGKWKQSVDDGRTKVLRRVAAMLLDGGDVQTFPFTASSGQVYPLTWDANTLDISYDQYRYKIKPSSSTSGMDGRAKLRSLFEILTALPAVLQVLVGMLHADPAKVMRVISDMAEQPALDELLPSADSQQIQTQILAYLTQQGQAKPGQAGQPGTGVAAPGPSPSMAPLLTQGAQLQSDRQAGMAAA